MYGTIEQLPEPVRQALTPEAQAIFLAAINAALESAPPDMTNPDSWAMQAAWTAVGRQLQPSADGGYDSILGPAMYTDGRHLTYTEHEAIIQTLERQDQRGIYLGQEAFAPTVDGWNEAYLIYAQDHPDPVAFDRDPEAELKRIGGRMVQGTARDARIDTVGHPTLRIAFDLDDKEIEDGIEEGKISTSNCFYCSDDGHKLTGTVRPHHILFFREEDGNLPGDRGVLVLNKSSGEDAITLIDRLRALIKGRRSERTYQEQEHNEEEENMADEKLTEMLADTRAALAVANEKIVALEEQLAKASEAGEAKDAEIAELKEKNKEYLAREKDAKWSAFKGKHIPPGMVAGDKEAALRKEFETAPEAVFERILAYKADEAEDGDGEEPMEYTSKKGRPRKAEDQLADLGIPSVNFVGGGQ